jgi:hypothetical protein
MKRMNKYKTDPKYTGNPNNVKVGDIVKPMEDRLSSNGWTVKDIEKAKVLHIMRYAWDYERFKVSLKVLEGKASCGEIDVFADFLTHYDKPSSTYEIY